MYRYGRAKPGTYPCASFTSFFSDKAVICHLTPFSSLGFNARRSATLRRFYPQLSAQVGSDFRYWHEADISTPPSHVCFQG
jgi:hypothetical protein